MKKRYLPLLLLGLVACDNSEPVKSEAKPFKTFTGPIVVEQDVDLPTLGRQQTVGGLCFIKLKQYPICLQHEVRHCIEGDWHKGVKSDEDCFE